MPSEDSPLPQPAGNSAKATDPAQEPGPADARPDGESASSLAMLRARVRRIWRNALWKRTTTLGLDLGATGLRAVEVSRQGDRIRVHGWGAVEFDEEVEDWSRVNALDIAQKIRDMVRQRGLGGPWVAHTVGGQAVAPQYFNFPKIAEGSLDDAVRIEVEAGLPFRVEEALVGYIAFPVRTGPDGKPRTHGVAFAADGTVVESRLNVLRKAELEPFCVEPDATACANALLATMDRPPRGPGSTAILNVGHRYSSLALFDGDGTLLARDVPWGGVHVTRVLAERLDLDPKEAERLKRAHWQEGPSAAGDLADHVDDLLRTSAQELVERVRDTLRYWSGERLAADLTRLFVTGGGSQIRGLPEALGEGLGVPVQRWAPPLGDDKDPDRDWTSQRYRMTVAFGAALRRFSPGGKP